MPIREVFPNPTVRNVIFQITFPNLFFMESKIGELQLRVMQQFPKTALLFRRKVVFADVGPQGKLEELSKRFDEESAKKIWQFKAERNYAFSVTGDSLDITSEFHKTYNLGETDKFRDILKLVMDNFLAVTSIPILTRIGLRYVDECPLPSKDNETLRTYYNSAFPIRRFNIANAVDMLFRTVTEKGDLNLIYMETLTKPKDDYKLSLDFDGFATNVPAQDYLRVTDRLHELISKEYERTIKEPVYEYMRQRRANNGQES